MTTQRSWPSGTAARFRATVIVFTGVCASASAFAAPAGATPMGPSPYAADVPAAIRTAPNLGRVPANQPIDFIVALALRHRDELDALIRMQQDRHSPLRHHWLTPVTFAEHFGVDPRVSTSIANTLRAEGFRVGRINRTGTLIEASGPAALVERLYQTRLGRYRDADGDAYANLTPAVHPREFGGADLGVVGLDTLSRAVPFATAPFKARDSHARHGSRPHPSLGGGIDGAYQPVDLNNAYDMPIGFITAGGGATMGIVMVNDFHQRDLRYWYNNDLASWYASLGLAIPGLHPSRIVAAGTPKYSPNCGNDPNCSVEVTLDIENSLSYEPQANEEVYEFSKFKHPQVVMTYDRVVSDNTADLVNSSFGECEQRNFDRVVDQAFAQGAAQGQSFFASSGDYGNQCFNGSGLQPGVSFPASDPNVVAVGGTSLNYDTSGGYIGETAWPGSGGGVSTVFAIPSYQQGIAGEASTTFRNVPDVSMNADPNPGDETIFAHQLFAAGGTSFSSPQVMSVFEAIVASGYGRQGNPNSEFYFIESTGPSGSSHDITSGCNGAYCAGPGYDNVTGWGSLDGTNLNLAWF